ncbi:MAG TPA: polyprenyl synthetase family protein [Dehalococcoidia bacterium]|nr:polyprenyl synthetase family protein [Dehalococcoidia bacterium]
MPLTDAAEARVHAALERHRAPLLAGLRAAIDAPRVGYARYMRYHFGWESAAGATIDEAAGKLLRPALCLVSCEAAHGDPARAMPAAIALELVHNFTLIHDDIEDGSDTRHGRATLWRLVGIPQAINAGDGMFVIARRTLLGMADAGVPAQAVLGAARTLDDACVALCEGQYADIGFEERPQVSVEEYEAMIAGKTAALLGAAAAIGALAAGADARTVDALHACGRLLGMAFQVQDDVLGIWGDAEATGKPVADDIRSRKKSFPVVYAMANLPEASRAELAAIYRGEHVDEAAVGAVLRLLEAAGARDASTAVATRWAAAAVEALHGLDLEPERRADLEAFAEFFVRRKV